jgi:flagellar basal body rod protein FlgG
LIQDLVGGKLYDTGSLFSSCRYGSSAKQNDTLADNIANVNTHGFKRKRVDFEDTIYQAMRNPADPESQENLCVVPVF